MVTAGDIIRQARREAGMKETQTVKSVQEFARSSPQRTTQLRENTQRIAENAIITREQEQAKLEAEKAKVAEAEVQQKAIRDDFSVSYRVVRNIGADEIQANVTIMNKSLIDKEYRAFMKDSIGQILDKEPDFHFANINAGQTNNIRLSTVGKRVSINAVGPTISFEVVTQRGESLGTKTFETATGRLISSTGTPTGEIPTAEGAQRPDTTLPEGSREGFTSDQSEGSGFLGKLGINPTTAILGGALILVALNKGK